MATDLIATAFTTIDAPADAVWTALTSPDTVSRWMLGTELTSDFEVGGPISWAGEWQGTRYEDHGTVLAVSPGDKLQVTHFSPLGGQEDAPENYHTLTYTLKDNGRRTLLTLTQDHNDSAEAQAHSTANWQKMLASLKEVVESAE